MVLIQFLQGTNTKNLATHGKSNNQPLQI